MVVVWLSSVCVLSVVVGVPHTHPTPHTPHSTNTLLHIPPHTTHTPHNTPRRAKYVGGFPRQPDGKIDYSEDFFGKPAYLTVSGQLQGEIYACSLSNIYTFGMKIFLGVGVEWVGGFCAYIMC